MPTPDNEPRQFIGADAIKYMPTASLPKSVLTVPGVGPVLTQNVDFVGLAHHSKGAKIPETVAEAEAADIDVVVLYMARAAEPGMPFGVMFQQIMTADACDAFAREFADAARKMRDQASRQAADMLDQLARKANP